jgi:hypothetical protein
MAAAVVAHRPAVISARPQPAAEEPHEYPSASPQPAIGPASPPGAGADAYAGAGPSARPAPPLRQPPAPKQPQQHLQQQLAPGERVGVVRQAAGERWVDTRLLEWPDNDFRIFVGNLGVEVTDAQLAAAFQHYPTFQRARVVGNAHTKKSKGYGFVSIGDPTEGAAALREMHGKYIGNRPCQLKRSNTEARTVTDHKGRAKKRVVPDKPAKPSKRPNVGPGPPRRDGGGGF